MDGDNIFRDALKSFTNAAASGGAITHLADLGYTPREIQNMLDFPTPYSQVQEAFWNYSLEKQIIVEEKSMLGKKREEVHFVTDYNDYGRRSFRRVVEYVENEMPEPDFDTFRTESYTPDVQGTFVSFLQERGCGPAYVSCDFGLRMKRDQKAYETFLAPLDPKQRLYMEGVPWRRKTVWHLLDRRMTEILAVLYEKSSYHGTILLLDKKEQIVF